jgi:hypothetical protein
MTRVATLPRNRTIVRRDAPTLEFQVLWQNLARAIESDGTDILNLQAFEARIGGYFGTRSVTATGALAVDDGLVLANATAGNITLTLPTAASAGGLRIAVKKTDASLNTVTIDGNGAETIDGAANRVLLTQYAVVTVMSDGTQWWVV